MEKFFENNKIFIGIIIAAFIIGGFIYFSNKPDPTFLPAGGSEAIETPKTSSVLPKISKCIDYTEAREYIGEQGCITGKVDHVFTSNKGNNFLNFCANYKTCPFSAVIFNSDAHKFSNIKSYGGKTLEITGLIKNYQGRAEIIINDPSQVKIK